jgi:3-oxoacyl-[acyl-carrier protein] reductase
METLNGKVAIVTGAAGTMGEAVTRGYLEDGLTVFAVDLAAEKLDALAEELGPKCRPLPLDITDVDAVDAGIAAIEKEFGAVDVLANNAGILSNERIATTSLDEWNKILGVNLTGAFLMTQRVLPKMRKRGWGRIVNTSSYSARSGGVSSGISYTVSKGGMVALTRAVAIDTLKDGITCNAIAPAWVKTPMVTVQLTPEQQKEVLAKIPVGRFCEPEEFAHTVRFLTSPLAGFITGEVIDMNGGARFG